MSNEVTKQRWDEIYEALAKPFPAELVEFKPGPGANKGGMVTAFAHADARAYIDRLNKVVGVNGWSTEYNFVTVPYTKVTKNWTKPGEIAVPDTITEGYKVLCTARLSILGVTRSSTKEEESDDANVATTPESLAFKRACMTFGLGRYLYDLPLLKANYDSKKKEWVQEPVLPDWAIPPYECDDCHKDIGPGDYNGKEITVARLISESKKKYDKNLCYSCQKVRAKTSTSDRGVTSQVTESILRD